jgi:hypothetical protein
VENLVSWYRASDVLGQHQITLLRIFSRRVDVQFLETHGQAMERKSRLQRQSSILQVPCRELGSSLSSVSNGRRTSFVGLFSFETSTLSSRWTMECSTSYVRLPSLSRLFEYRPILACMRPLGSFWIEGRHPILQPHKLWAPCTLQANKATPKQSRCYYRKVHRST